MKNNYTSKLIRTFTSVLPVSKKRKGQCIGCGECCKALPNRCPFLTKDDNNKPRCAIYKVRPLNCRKYPRTKKEWLTPHKCGFSFDE